MLREMILHYRDTGQRVDEVLYQEVTKVINLVEQFEADRESLSMAHDDLQRENIQLRNRVQELEKDNHDVRWMCADISIKLQESDKQNKRYRESIYKAIANFNQDRHQEGMSYLQKALEGEK